MKKIYKFILACIMLSGPLTTTIEARYCRGGLGYGFLGGILGGLVSGFIAQPYYAYAPRPLYYPYGYGPGPCGPYVPPIYGRGYYLNAPLYNPYHYWWY